jgi:hypothetical protein
LTKMETSTGCLLLRTCLLLQAKWRKSKISQVGTGVLC